METFGDDLSKKDKPNFQIRSEKALQTENQEEAKFNDKKDEEANKLGFGTGPWWRLVDGEELASLVAQRSVKLIENCDLPQPQSSHFRGGLAGNFPLSLRLNARSANNNTQGNCTSSVPEAQVTESDLTKTELLEALCRCQTRAREAERLASQAYAEKEQIGKLFFQQASHLFAYKQWLQLLQLENHQLQNKINDSSYKNGDDNDQLYPVPFAVDRKSGKLNKMKKNPTRRKHIRKQTTCDYISKLGVGFAIGFGLVGAGLLLGWTVGWILPLF